MNNNIKITLDILPVIYKSKRIENVLTSGSFDVDEYEIDFISSGFYNPYIAISLDIINNKLLTTQYFLYGIIELMHSNGNDHKIDEKNLKLSFFNIKVPGNLCDLSSWNSFLSSFKNIKEEDVLLLDSIFTMQYLMDNLKIKEPEFYQKLYENSPLKLNDDIKADIIHFLFNQYISYCQDKKSPSLFYSQGYDLNLIFNNNVNKDNTKLNNFTKTLYDFSHKKIYLKKEQVLKTINKANKYFYSFLFEQED
jgi:hypothetical protein